MSRARGLFDLTLRGIEESCLLNIYVNFLEALPGTPLYRRMKLAGRLRDGVQGEKRIESKIRYLLDDQFLMHGYIAFARRFATGETQYRRFAAFLRNLEVGRYVRPRTSDVRNVRHHVAALLRNRLATMKLARQLFVFAGDPRRLWHVLRALALVARAREVPGALGFFMIWFSDWSRFVLAHRKLGTEDFDIESVHSTVTGDMILPEGYEAGADAPIPQAKIQAQIRNTVTQLRRLAVKWG